MFFLESCTLLKNNRVSEWIQLRDWEAIESKIKKHLVLIQGATVNRFVRTDGVSLQCIRHAGPKKAWKEHFRSWAVEWKEVVIWLEIHIWFLCCFLKYIAYVTFDANQNK